jgi:hypothetical protein
MEKYYFETAEGFIFDNEYYIQWGDYEVNLKEFLEFLDIEIVWFREGVLDKLNRKWKFE